MSPGVSPDDVEFLSLPAARNAVERLLGEPVSYWSVWRAVSDGRVPSVRIGNQYGVNRQHVPALATIIGPTSRSPLPAA
jgi:hypothetical protein